MCIKTFPVTRHVCYGKLLHRQRCPCGHMKLLSFPVVHYCDRASIFVWKKGICSSALLQKEWCVPLPKIHTSYQSSYRSRSGYDMLGPDQHCILCLLSKSWKSDVDTVRLWKCLDVLHRRLKIYRDTWNSNPNGPVVLAYLHIGTHTLTLAQPQREHCKRWDWSRSRRFKFPHNRSVVMVRVLRLGQRLVCTPCRW